MRLWEFIKRVPKFALIFGVIVVSTLLFLAWWHTHQMKPAIEKHEAAAVALIAAEPERIILVDNDLYDLDTGALVFKNWLPALNPRALFYDAKTSKILAQYERGFIRYTLDGREDAKLFWEFPPAYSDNLKWAVYPKQRDLWRADIDWKNFKLSNERRLTNVEQFNERYFAANIMLATDNTAIVRNNNQLLRIDLDTGDVRQEKIPIQEIGKRRSPSGRYLIGYEREQVYCFDVDTDETKTIRVGRGVISDYQWLGNDRCAAIADHKTVFLYERLKNTLVEIAAVPPPLYKIGEPSPGGRFVFCEGRGKGALVDLERKVAMPVPDGSGICWVRNDTFAFSREVANSELRGIWLQTVGEGERRVSAEPYLVGKSGPMMLATSGGVIVYATKNGLSKMKADGTGVGELIGLLRPPTRVVAIVGWKL